MTQSKYLAYFLLVSKEVKFTENSFKGMILQNL